MDEFLNQKKGDNAKWKHGGQGETDHKKDDKGWTADVKKKSASAANSNAKDKDSECNSWGKWRMDDVVANQ